MILADASHQLPGVFDSLEPTLRHYGYLAVGGVLFLEDFGVPLPGETMLIAAALYAGTGSLNIWLVAVIAVVAAVAGDNVGFAIGHFGGRALLDRFGKYVLLTPERLDKVEDFFRRHGEWVVVIARFVEGLRQANGLVAGTVEMPWRRFFAANVVGAIAWVAVWASLGYFAGNHVETISTYATYIAIGLAVLAIVVIARHVLIHRRSRNAGPA
jgi:membrane protein DedA with SNARE-associated domain